MSERVLIVDDDETIRRMVGEILGFEGYSVETATNGAEALEAIDRAQPALMLLDMRMPVVDGWDVARALKERGIKVPIVVMTAARDAQAWSDEIGADSCLPKPFELDALLDVVEHFYVA